MDDISLLVKDVLKDVADVYAVLADMEKVNEMQLPIALYKVTGNRNRTKERVQRTYDVSVMVVAATYDKCTDIMQEVTERLEGLNGSDYVVSGASSDTDYDGDDRVYIGNVNVSIKYLKGRK